MLSPAQLIDKFNITLTQRQAALTILALYFLGAVLVTLIELVSFTVDAAPYLAGGLGGAVLFGGAWILYYRWNWEPARYFTTVAFTAIVALFLPEPFVSDYAPMAVVLPLILAHILANSFWVVINAFLTIGILLIRAGGSGVYSNPSTLILYAMIGGGLLIKRLIEVTSIRQVRQAEEEIKQSEIRFRSLIENASDEICIIDTSGTLLYESPTSSPTLGYHPQEFLGSSLFQLVYPDDLERVRKIFTDLVDEARMHPRFQFRILHKNRTWRWIEGVATNLLNEPSVHGIVVNYHDVTERVESEEFIQRQLGRLSGLRQIDIAIGSSFHLHVTLGIVLQQVSSLLNVDACAVLLIDPEFQRVEHAASRGFQAASSELVDSHLSPGGGYAPKVILERRTIHISSISDASDEPAQVPHWGEEVFVDYYGTPLMVKGEVKGILEIYHRSSLQTDYQWLDFLEMLAGQAAIAIDNAQLFNSIQTANAELECRVAERTAQLNKTNAELERANHTKDEFLATMSHELRTPLNSIIGLSESLLEQKRGNLNNQQQKSLQIIESSGHHLLELINDILDLSKIEAKMFDFYPQPISVDEFCRSCLSFVRAQSAKKSITISYIPEPAVTKIFADPRRLKQILVNLLINAVKFTSEKGHVILRVHADTEQDRISFSVIDNGIGISAKDFERLFQPFVQLDSSLSRQYDGTGLGLSLVQKLTDLHGGSVTVESEVGKGSCFTINLPCKLEEVIHLEEITPDFNILVQHNPAGMAVPSDEIRKTDTILLVEDNMSNILMISEYLEANGYQVVVAHDGLEAIEKAEETNPDLILMDIQMPALNGIDAIARLRGNPCFSSTPIVALTALAMPGDRERCLLAGATEYVSKPVSLRNLKQLIENLLEAQPAAYRVSHL
jgi:PAS domain S-box-containing protein